MSTFYHNGCQLAASNAACVDTHAVFLDTKTFVRVVAIQDGGAVVFREGSLVFVPDLEFSC